MEQQPMARRREPDDGEEELSSSSQSQPLRTSIRFGVGSGSAVEVGALAKPEALKAWPCMSSQVMTLAI